VDTDPDTLNRTIGSGPALAEAIDDGRLTVTGDDQAGQRLFDAVAGSVSDGEVALRRSPD
jgi:hypothetical protein